MTEVYSRLIKGITGNSTASVKIFPSPDKRLHGCSLNVTFGTQNTTTDTLAEQLAGLTFRVKTGNTTRREVTGTQLRDYLLLNGTTHDCDAVSTYVSTYYIPFAEDWFIANVADMLAWNPRIVGPISIEIVSTLGTITVVAHERISDDLDAPSAGIITWEVITPVSGGVKTITTKELEIRGQLIQASIYPDTGGSNAATQASLMVGADNKFAYEEVPVAANADILGRAGLTPAASGRTASIYDMVFVRGDALTHAIDLSRHGSAKFDIRAAASTGSWPILLARLEAR